MTIEEMIKADYEIIAIAPDRDPAKDRDVTGDVEELLQLIAGLGDAVAGRTKPIEQVRRELAEPSFESTCFHCSEIFKSRKPDAALCMPCFVAGHRGFTCDKFCIVTPAGAALAAQFGKPST